MTRSTTLGKRVNVYLPAGEWDRIMALADRLRADGWRVTDMRGVVTFATVVRALADAYSDAVWDADMATPEGQAKLDRLADEWARRKG